MKNIVEIKELLAQTGQPGNISEDLMAYFLSTKRTARQEKMGDDFNAFAMSTKEVAQLADIIEQMIANCEKDLRFQIAISKWDGSAYLNHWSFLEFNFKATEFPSLDILICDPLGLAQSLVLTNLLTNEMEFGRISQFCNLQIYVPTDILQNAGRGCAYFTTDSISMLSTQDKYSPIYDYMDSHQEDKKQKEAKHTLETYRNAVAICYTKEELDDMYDFNLVVSALPVRLLRTQQNVASLEEVRDSTELNAEVVNSKGEGAWSSIKKHLFFVADRSGIQQYRNMRVNKKMEKLGEHITEISSSLNTEEDIRVFNEAVQRHRLSGLADLVEHNSKQEEYTFSTLG